MKKFKHVALLLLATVMVFGCSKYDDTELRNDVSDLQSRVDKLEKWCTTTNGQISALQGLVTALQGNDYVTGVSPVTVDGKTGYTITFSKSKAITIFDGANGAAGTTPIIGVAKHTDGLYYWTVKTGDADATWMRDADGKMIRTTGDKGADGSIGSDGKTPVLSVATDTDGKVYWKLNGEWLMSDGKKVQATGDKGDKGDNGAAGSAGEAGEDGKDGDSIFKKDGIDLTDPNNVTFTLADGTTKITLPRTSAVKIFDSFDNFKITTQDAATPLALSLNIKDADYKAIKAELTSSAGLTTAIKTRAAGTPWQVAITAPTFKADGTVDVQPVVSITAKDAAEGDIALLKVTVVDSKGDEHTATRVLFYSTKVDVESVTMDETLALVVNEEKSLTATVLPAGAAQTVTWTSSDETVATVAPDGKVKGIKAGTAKIKAVSTSDATKFDECTVTVSTVAVESITFDAGKTVSIGGKVTLVATILPANATVKTVTWASDDATVAIVNATTGEVEGKAEGEVTITATATDGSGVTGTCKVTVTKEETITWAVGNLVADGDHGAKIGTANDGGLFFQFGSLVGWSTTDPLAVAISPVGYAGSTMWDKDWTSDPATENVATGTGDPCKYYLKGTWRLPTNDEYKALFNNVTDGNYANSGGWSWDATAKSATNNTKNLTFPASGYRDNVDGSLSYVGTFGYYWSASPSNANFGYSLFFYSSYVNPSVNSNRALGYPVRCVQNASN